MEVRVCHTCRDEKPSTAFYATSKRKCKSCVIATARRWQAANPDRRKATADAWRAANPDRVRARYVAAQERLMSDPARRQALRDRTNRRNAEVRAARPPDFRKALVKWLAEFHVKTCLHCSTPKRFSDFHPHQLGSSGLNSWCRDCKNAIPRTEKDRARLKALRSTRDFKEAKNAAERARRAARKLHDAHVSAYHAVGEAIAKWVEKTVARNRRIAERLERRRTERIPPNASPNRVKKLKRKHAIERATPRWADRAAIDARYAERDRRRLEDGQDWTIDHEIPLQNPLVCGLHVAANLRVILRSENSRKGNSVWPDMP